MNMMNGKMPVITGYIKPDFLRADKLVKSWFGGNYISNILDLMNFQSPPIWLWDKSAIRCAILEDQPVVAVRLTTAWLESDDPQCHTLSGALSGSWPEPNAHVDHDKLSELTSVPGS